MNEEEEYDRWCEWYLSDIGYEEEYVQRQQEMEEFPLFFWRKTCRRLDNEI